jgi:hypothetical protein
MRNSSQRAAVRITKSAANPTARWLFVIWLVIWAGIASGEAEDFAALCSDRAAIERVYYNHRLGDKPLFEQALPPATLERLVRDDLRKEAGLEKAYHVEVTPAMVETEVRRINTTTRAPDVLAELKAALGNNTNRFAQTVAKPIVVERLLHDHFEKDDLLHAPQRQQVEQTRNELLAAKTNGADSEKLLALLKRNHTRAVTETTWQLGVRPAETNALTADELEIMQRFGPNAQVLSSPQADQDRKFYFEDLPLGLQNVLRVQLRQSGDVSAVIETPGGFLLYVCKARTAETLNVAALSLPKRSYEQWLAEQEGGTK